MIRVAMCGVCMCNARANIWKVHEWSMLMYVCRMYINFQNLFLLLIHPWSSVNCEELVPCYIYVFCCQLSKRHRNGHLPKVDWLDRLTFREIEIINERLKQHSNFLYLMIEFPRFQCNNSEYSVFYFEKVCLYIPTSLHLWAWFFCV